MENLLDSAIICRESDDENGYTHVELDVTPGDTARFYIEDADGAVETRLTREDLTCLIAAAAQALAQLA